MFSPCRALGSRWAGNRGQGERPGEALAWSLLALHPPHPLAPSPRPLPCPSVCVGRGPRSGRDRRLSWAEERVAEASLGHLIPFVHCVEAGLVLMLSLGP